MTDPAKPNTRQMRALQVLAMAALAALLWIAHPVGVGLLLGALLAFTLQPAYGRLRARHMRPATSAVLCVGTAMLAVVAVLVSFAFLFVSRGVTLAQRLPTLIAKGGAIRSAAEHALRWAHFDPNVVIQQTEQRAVSLGSRVATVAASLAGVTLTSLLTFFFMSLSAYYVLRHWELIVTRAEGLSPLLPKHTRALLGEFRRTGSEILRGTVITGVIQGLLAGLGYWVCGVPDPAFFGALTAVASLVPAVGTMLVWVPVGVFLLLTGKPVRGVIELVYGAIFVVAVTDYVIRPRLVGGSQGVPAVLTFVSLFGGVEVFGAVGLIVGPVIVTVAVAVLRTYEQAVKA